MTSALRLCPKCGSEIPSDAPEGGCPGCLLESGLGLFADAPVAEVDLSAVAAYSAEAPAKAGSAKADDRGRVDNLDSNKAARFVAILGEFGDFEITRREDGSLWELGRGGMGVTYQARDAMLHRSVALKVIEVPPEAGNSKAMRERFLREARATAALRHPNVAAVYHFGTVPEPDRCYYAMELVEGETLEARVRREGPLKIAQVLEIGVQVTRALIAAANQGLIHRDLKPANIMLTRSEDSSAGFEVKVIDFGLAKVTAESFGEMDLTHGGFVGTPSYASPEQFAGGRVDARSDIYSLGVSLWFALTGRLPCAGTSVEEIRHCQTEAPLPVQQVVARKVPALVIELLRSMLAVDPDERPASARELMEALENCRSKLTRGNETARPSFFAELKRRNVYKVAIAYGVVAWLLMQVASQIFPFFEIPNWAVRLVVLLLIIGFPVAVILAWAFELTPEGIKREEDVDLGGSIMRKTGRKLDFFIIAVLVLVIGLLLFQRLHHNVPQVVSSSPEKSIAVLPFENLSREPDNAYFSEGIQQEILTKLTGIGDLKVISRTSTAKYKSKPEDLKTVARELGVAAVLEGSVQKAGGKVRVNVQLVDAHNDTHLWAKSYDRNINDIFTVERDIAQEIADTLQAKLSPAQANALVAMPTRDAEAYDLFLKGEYQEREAESTYKGDTYDRAATFYQQALAHDPGFALAYARLACNRLYRHWYVGRLTSAQLQDIRSNVESALAIAPDSPEAHLAMGIFHYWGRHDFDTALREFDRAIERQPNNSDTISFRAAIYRRRGEWRRALAEFERAMKLDPRAAWMSDAIGSTYLLLRRWSEAEHWFKHALALDPHHLGVAFRLSQTYIASTGDIQRARQAWEGVPNKRTVTVGAYEIVISEMIDNRVYLDVLERHFSEALKAWDAAPDNTVEGRLTQLKARIGIQVLAGQNAAAERECEEARVLLEAQLAQRRSEDSTSFSELAWIYVCLGRNADALRLAREAAESMPIEKDAVLGANFLVGLAQIEAHTGQPEQAVKILRQLLTIPAGEFISVARLKIDPVWDAIRNDPGFQKLLSEPEPVTVYK